MKAIRIHKPGGPDVLKYEDAPRPKPKIGEILIRVHAASVNPADWQMITRNPANRRYPWIPGYDVSGVVTALGEGVSDCEVGDEVYGMLYPKPAGAYAEYAVVPTSQIARKPRSLLHFAALAGAVKQADDAVGRILDGLKKSVLEDSIIVIFTVDRAVELGRRANWTCYDAGMEIALPMREPAGVIKGGHEEARSSSHSEQGALGASCQGGHRMHTAVSGTRR
jgi:hypothetical protein